MSHTILRKPPERCVSGADAAGDLDEVATVRSLGARAFEMQRAGPAPGEIDRSQPATIVVCVCTLDRPEGLGRCLRSILRQDLPKHAGNLHIVVADNSTHARERDAMLALKADGAAITYVHEPIRGIPYARNAALRVANDLRPVWIAFIDDDEVASPGWLARMLEIGESKRVDVVHGECLTMDGADIENVAAAWRVPSAVGPVKSVRKAATNNVLLRGWLVSRPVALRFDTGMHFGGSDGEFFMRAVDRGAAIVHTREAPVFEERHAEREMPTWQRKRAFRLGANCNYRYRKNRQPSLLAAALLCVRAAERSVSGLNRMVVAMCLLPFRRSRGGRFAQRGILDFCFAWGCLAPYFGVTPAQYY